jgi:hypothetical protein
MKRLVLFIAVTAAVLACFAAVTWWVDPLGEIWKPAALEAAQHDDCLISQELIGTRYFSFKVAVFHDRPTRTFVVGSSRVLKIASHPHERSFANLGYPGTAPATILSLVHALPAMPRQTMYIGVESFWFNRHYRVPDTNPSDYRVAEYLVSRSAFWSAFKFARDVSYVRYPDRWRRTTVGNRCTIGRTYPSINWALDGSRVWSWELDPKHFQRIYPTPYRGNLDVWRNGYYADWKAIDQARVAQLEQVLAFARARGWRVIGFAPPEPSGILHILNTDPRIAPQWRAFLRLMPKIFRRYHDPWIGLAVRCPASAFPDAFHTDAACSRRMRNRLDEAARLEG